MSVAAALLSSATTEWPTPPDLYARLDRAYGPFTLDPCATPDNAKCAAFYTADDDGLAQPWAPHRVFMNPPYARNVTGKWFAKAHREAQAGALVVGLVPARTETRYWHDHALAADELIFMKGRVRFVGAKDDAPFPSAIVVWRPGVTAEPASRNACEVCRGVLLASRSDCRCCSSACRQQAYRQRKAGAS